VRKIISRCYCSVYDRPLLGVQISEPLCMGGREPLLRSVFDCAKVGKGRVPTFRIENFFKFSLREVISMFEIPKLFECCFCLGRRLQTGTKAIFKVLHNL